MCDKDVERGVALVFEALQAAYDRYVEAGGTGEPSDYVGYFSTETGVIDLEVAELVKALLYQGWSMPAGSDRATDG